MKTEIIKITDPAAQAGEVARIGKILRDGGLAAIPTETVYGLAGNAFDGSCVRRIFEAKGRPGDNPLIVHIADFDEIYGIAAEVPEQAKLLADAFWPGPLTIILKKKDAIPAEVTAGQSTVAVRMPSHPVARAIIKAAGVPLAAPSANISGFPSPTSPGHVIDDMNGRIEVIADGGECEYGIESTVLSLTGNRPRILRPGAVTRGMLEKVVGPVDVDKAVLEPLEKGAVAASPGMKYKHYSPRARLMIVGGSAAEFRAYADRYRDRADFCLCFEGEEKDMPLPCVTFGRADDSLSQAKRFFRALRELDEAGAQRVFVRAPSKEGVGMGVCNRLYRAAGFTFAKEAPGRIIGIGGLSGSGKTTVCAYLESRGCKIIDADKIARRLLDEDKSVVEELKTVFGDDVAPDGTVDRRTLASRAFASREATQKLNAVTHPKICDYCEREAKFYALAFELVCIDAPLLFSSGLDSVCCLTARVFAPEDVRLARITARDGITEAEALKRFASQREEELLSQRADKIINNYGQYDPYEETDKFLSEVNYV